MTKYRHKLVYTNTNQSWVLNGTTPTPAGSTEVQDLLETGWTVKDVFPLGNKDTLIVLENKEMVTVESKHK